MKNYVMPMWEYEGVLCCVSPSEIAMMLRRRVFVLQYWQMWMLQQEWPTFVASLFVQVAGEVCLVVEEDVHGQLAQCAILTRGHVSLFVMVFLVRYRCLH
jgi:hypothetical protein